MISFPPGGNKSKPGTRRTKVDAEKWEEIVALRSTGWTYKELAKEFECGQTTIKKIIDTHDQADELRDVDGRKRGR